MKGIDLKSTQLLDAMDELLILDTDTRKRLCQMKKTLAEFSQLIKIPDKYYKIEDSYEWITLYFEIKSNLRDDLIQHYEFTCSASGSCTLEVKFKTPKLVSYNGKVCAAETHDNIAYEFNTEVMNFTYDDSSECSDSVIWSASVCLENPEPETSDVLDAFEKLHAAACGLTRTIELEFWNAFDKAQVSSFTNNPFELYDVDLSADYELYEGDTFIGTQAYMGIITELAGEDLVVNKIAGTVVVESTEYFEFSSKEKRRTYRFEPSDSDGYVVSEQVLIDGEKRQYKVGEIRRITENALLCCLANSFCNNKGNEEIIIVSYDHDAIRAFVNMNTLIATIKKSEDNDNAIAFEGMTMMKCKYTVFTEQYFTKYIRLLAAIPYLNFS